MRKSVVILFICLLTLPSFGQSELRPAKDLTTLLAERDKLYKDYVYYRDQKSSFWGTQSKKDLKLVIDVLKGIITKDTEIVETVRVQGLRKESSYIGQSREITDRIYALNAEVERLNTQLGKQRKQLKEAQEELEEAKNSSKSFMILSIILALVCVGTFFYKRKVR
jgi:phosphoglycerate-specific signal transduction histidine kinase